MSDDGKKPENPVAAVLRRAAAEHREDCGVGQIFRQFADALEGRDAENATSAGGPAQVATAQYRNNYDTIFGKKQVVGQA
jgi:hypothetical protein